MTAEEYEILYHGISSGTADRIRDEKILCGGTTGYRAHINLATGVHQHRNPVTGQMHGGVKGDAYVEVNTAELLKYHFEGAPVKIWINDKGVALTYGAKGDQPDGHDSITRACIPAALCQKIDFVSNGDFVWKSALQVKGMKLEPKKREPLPMPQPKARPTNR